MFFAALYFSEGAPIGFLWWALPTLLSAAGAPLGEVTALTAVLVIPWTLKFLWAPYIDRWRGGNWNWPHWIVAAQLVMMATLLPLAWLDLADDLSQIRLLLICHAFAAATQDVAIDGLCIASTTESERGRINGWMQAGMLSGRSIFGGGALVLMSSLGQSTVVLLLITATGFSSLLVLGLMLRGKGKAEESLASNDDSVWRSLIQIFQNRQTWWGLGFALTAGAGFEALGAVQGPLLLARGLSQEWIGWMQAVPNVIAMLLGGLAGGWWADRSSHRSGVLAGMGVFVSGVLPLGALLQSSTEVSAAVWLSLFAWQAFGVGMFTAASYALLMDLARPPLSATRFSLFMAGTNGCESWAASVAGRTIPRAGPLAVLGGLCGVSLLCGGLLLACLPGQKHTRPVSD